MKKKKIDAKLFVICIICDYGVGKEKALKRHRSKKTSLHNSLYNLKISFKIVKAMDHIKHYNPPYTNSKFLIIGTTRTTQKSSYHFSTKQTKHTTMENCITIQLLAMGKDHHNILFRAFQAFD